MSDVQRYALRTDLNKDTLGEWIRYEDHLDEVAWAVSEVLDTAREAVRAMENIGYPEFDFDHITNDVIDVLDALREKQK